MRVLIPVNDHVGVQGSNHFCLLLANLDLLRLSVSEITFNFV